MASPISETPFLSLATSYSVIPIPLTLHYLFHYVMKIGFGSGIQTKTGFLFGIPLTLHYLCPQV